YHGSASGLASTPAWTAESDQANAQFGLTVGTAGDVNGNGYSDVIVGAYLYDNGQTDEGRAYVYHGSAGGLSTVPNWMAESDQANAAFGVGVGTAGDVNGDGYSDVIIGAYAYDNGQTNEGMVFVYHGSASGLSAIVDWTAESNQDNAYFGGATAGDVNGDGYSDVIVSAPLYDNGEIDEGRTYVYHGSAMGLSTSPDWTAESGQVEAQFGNSIGTAGDVNGDGYSDVIIGARRFDNSEVDEGRAYVYHGSASGLSPNAVWIAESDQANAWFGLSVGTAGDVNGDGYSDIIVGAYIYDNGQENEGRTFVYYGSASGVSTVAWMAEGNQDSAYFGMSVGTAGDVNGDGYSDVIVGAQYYDNGETNEGRAYVYYGSGSGLSTSPVWMAEGDQAGALFGYAVGTAGDVNGDGYADVIVAALYYDNGQTDEGCAFVYHGSASGLAATPTWTAESNQAYASFGHAVGTAGDVNGDGYADIIVSARQYDNGQINEGRTYVYHGSASGLSAAAAWTAESDQAYAYLGTAVGTAGDVNGDGYSDIIVGAPDYDNEQTDEGRVYVYYGSASGLSSNADWVVESDQPTAWFGFSVGTAGDVNDDGYSDIIIGAHGYDNDQTDEGRAFVYYGSASGLTTTAIWTTESDQAGAYLGYAAGTAGDVNGDGYSDVIVGALYYDNGQTDEGRAYVYYGSASGLSPNAAWVVESDLNTAWFGFKVGTAGDVNGDGYADVIVGAPYYDNGEADEGGAFLYYGNDSAGLSLLPRQLRSDGATPIAYLGQSDSRTTFQLSLIGRSPLGCTPVKLQWQVVPLGTPFTATNIVSGTSLAWTDVLTTGVVITEDVTGLSLGTPYHWRVRLLYHPENALGQPSSRWVTIPWNGWNETDLRTLSNQPPVADAGPDQGVDTNAVVALDGSASSDPDGDLPLTYRWTQSGGPAVTLSDPAVVNPTFTAPGDPTVLTFTLTVTDSLGLASAPNEVVITVNNRPPVADAGSDQSVDTNAAATLDGSGSSDPDGDLPLVCFWTQTGGPAVTLSNLTVVNPTFTAPDDPAILTFTLTVTDSLGQHSAPDTVVVTITSPSPGAPTLVAPAHQTVTETTALDLTWGAVSGASGYTIDFNGAIVDVSNVTVSNTGVLKARAYTWTVAAYDVYGSVSEYAAPWAFAVAGAPVSVTLTELVTETVIPFTGGICGSVWFTDVGTLPDSLTITYTYNFPSVDHNSLLGQYRLVAVGGAGYQAALTLCYDDADLLVVGLAPAAESSLHAYRYIAAGQPWQAYSRVDPVANTVTADNVTEFGVFGLGIATNQPTVVGLHALLTRTVGGWPLWGGALLILGGAASLFRRRRHP
ncbi:MAG TPA: FG-GAP-like repeat-containing protein, partial [Anaerolineae bacterium]|nr:FG-GAP-like repeat-containing protein [Anaerolineae bacterium]